MATLKKTHMHKVCDICGGTGFAESIMTCFVCKRTSEHIYCMQAPLSFIPVTWVCGECSKRSQADTVAHAAYGKQETVGSSGRKTRTPLRRNLSPEGAKVKLIPVEEAILLSSHAKSRACNAPRTSGILLSAHTRASTLSTVGRSGAMPKPGNSGRTYDSQGSRHVQFHRTANSSLCLLPSLQRTTWGLPSSEGLKVHKVLPEQHKRSAELKVQIPSACIMSRTEISADTTGKTMVKESLERASKKFYMTNDIARSNIKSEESNFGTIPLLIDKEGKSTCPNSLGKSSYSEATDQNLTLLMNPDVKFETDPHPKICWEGIFEIRDTDFCICCAAQAYFPHHISYKVYEKQKQMPREMNFNVKHWASVWPKIFQLDPPDSDDIGLYFRPSDRQRSKEKYTHLLEYVDSHDVVLQCLIDDAEMIVCSSKHLTTDSRRLASQIYLWGYFRRVNHKKPCQNMKQKFPCATPGAAKRRDSCNQSNAGYAEHEEKPVGTSTQLKAITLPVLQLPPGFSCGPSSGKGSSLSRTPSSTHPSQPKNQLKTTTRRAEVNEERQ